MDLANYIQTIGRIIGTIVTAMLLYTGKGIESLLVGSTLSYVFIHVISIICIQRIERIRLLRISNLDVKRGRRILCFGGAVFGGSVVSMLLGPFNKLMLSRYAGVSTIPIYEIAFTGSMQVKGLIEGGLKALMPEISRIGASMTVAKDRISKIYRRAMKIIFLFGVLGYGILVVFAPLLLSVWLGEIFVETIPAAFRIMLIGSFLNLVGVPAYYVLMGIGQVHHNLRAHIVQSTINAAIILASVFLTSTVSLVTVVSSVSIGMMASTLYLIWRSQKIIRCLDFNKITTGVR